MSIRRRVSALRTRFRQRPRRIPWGRALLAASLVWVVVDILMLPPGDEFRRQNPQTTALIEARREEAAEQGKTFSVSLRWVSLKELPPHLIKAVIVSEDASFYDHQGFDFGEMFHAMSAALRTFSFPRGASTITQQLAKNLYLLESRNPLRKLREAVITLKIERALSKVRILEIYLNIIELGPQIFGVDAAARHYFGSSASALSEGQSAFLAAIIPNPRTVYNPKVHPERVRKRSAIIEKRMRRSIVPLMKAGP